MPFSTIFPQINIRSSTGLSFIRPLLFAVAKDRVMRRGMETVDGEKRTLVKMGNHH